MLRCRRGQGRSEGDIGHRVRILPGALARHTHALGARRKRQHCAGVRMRRKARTCAAGRLGLRGTDARGTLVAVVAYPVVCAELVDMAYADAREVQPARAPVALHHVHVWVGKTAAASHHRRNAARRQGMCGVRHAAAQAALGARRRRRAGARSAAAVCPDPPVFARRVPHPGHTVPAALVAQELGDHRVVIRLGGGLPRIFLGIVVRVTQRRTREPARNLAPALCGVPRSGFVRAAPCIVRRVGPRWALRQRVRRTSERRATYIAGRRRRADEKWGHHDAPEPLNVHRTQCGARALGRGIRVRHVGHRIDARKRLAQFVERRERRRGWCAGVLAAHRWLGAPMGRTQDVLCASPSSAHRRRRR